MRHLSRGWNAWIAYCDGREQNRSMVRCSIGHLSNRQLSGAWNAWVEMVIEMIAYLDVATMQFSHVIIPEKGARGAGDSRDLQHIWRVANSEKQDWALLNAAQKGHYWTVHALVKRGARVGVQDGLEQNALHVACFEGHLEVVKLLIKAEGTDVDAEDAYGHTALMLASLRGHLDVMRILFDAGASAAGHEEAEIS